MNRDAVHQTATLAGGCFWCLEAVFLQVKGVDGVKPGYTGGTTANPSYEEVCTGTTGHAEAVRIAFDPTRISYRTILEVFFSAHDPTSWNRQGPDAGTQYRSAIFYHNEEQKAISEEVVQELNKGRLRKKPIVTQIVPLDKFYPAEDHHREYFARHPEQAYCQTVISPKLSRFRKQWVKLAKR